MEILASGKTGANKYDLLENDPLKVLTRLDVRQLAEALQYLSEVTQGYSLSGDEGSSDALVTDLSIIDTTNIATYQPKFTQALQTLIAHQNTLAVDGTTTANAIVLVPKKISSDLAPNAADYTIVAPLPLKWQDDLQFTFRATIANTSATTLSIPSLSGLSGAVDLLDESGSALVGGEITIGKYITVVTKTISGNKKFLLIKALVTDASTTAKGVSYLPKQITISNGTDADHDLNFTAGNAQAINGTVVYAVGALTKQIDASWVAGTNQGGLDTGAVANNTPYYCYAIQNLTSGVGDILYTASVPNSTTKAYSGANMPSGWGNECYIGACHTDGSANIRAGEWTYDTKGASYKFLYTTEITDVTATLTGSAQTGALTAPAFSEVIVSHKHASQAATSTEQSCSYTNLVDSITNLVSSVRSINSTSNMNRQRLTIKVNASKQFQYQGGSANAGDALIITQGWQEYL